MTEESTNTTSPKGGEPTARRSLEELEHELDSHRRAMRLPATFRHKKSGGLYTGTNIGFDEGTMAPTVQYNPTGHPGVNFYRSLVSFMAKYERVDLDRILRGS